MAPISAHLFSTSTTVSILLVGCFAFGFHFTVAVITLYVNWRHSLHNTLFALSIITLGLIYCALSISNYFWQYSHWKISQFSPVADVFAMIITLLCKCFMTYQCYKLYNRNILITVVPLAALATTLVFGSFNAQYVTKPHGQPPLDTMPYLANRLIVYWSLNIGLSLVISTLIIGRMLYRQYTVKNLVGRHTRVQFGWIALIVESGIVYPLISAAAIPLVHVGSGYLVSPLHAHTECVVTELILMRSALGKTNRERDRITTLNHDDQGGNSNIELNERRTL